MNREENLLTRREKGSRRWKSGTNIKQIRCMKTVLCWKNHKLNNISFIANMCSFYMHYILLVNYYMLVLVFFGLFYGLIALMNALSGRYNFFHCSTKKQHEKMRKKLCLFWLTWNNKRLEFIGVAVYFISNLLEGLVSIGIYLLFIV